MGVARCFYEQESALIKCSLTVRCIYLKNTWDRHNFYSAIVEIRNQSTVLIKASTAEHLCVLINIQKESPFYILCNCLPLKASK